MLQRLYQRADAGMDGRRISEFLKRIESSEVLRLFFQSYIPKVPAYVAIGL